MQEPCVHADHHFLYILAIRSLMTDALWIGVSQRGRFKPSLFPGAYPCVIPSFPFFSAVLYTRWIGGR